LIIIKLLQYIWHTIWHTKRLYEYDVIFIINGLEQKYKYDLYHCSSVSIRDIFSELLSAVQNKYEVDAGPGTWIVVDRKVK
jgi:hypothetical protein